MADPDEQFEHIPWDDLMAEMGGRRRRVAYGAVAAVAVVLILVGAARMLRPAPEAVPVPAAAPTTATTPATVEPAGEDALPSEADLLAVDPGDLIRTAEAQAEWFVLEYFTRDGTAVGSALESARLGNLLPEPVAGDGTRSFVDWVRAVAVERVGVDRVDVVVVFRTLEAAADGPYRRLPIRGVRVALRLGGGGIEVMDLPVPVPVEPPVASTVPGAAGVPPPELVAAAGAVVASWGEPGDPLVAQQVEGGWRLVLPVRDAAGVTWPLTVLVDGTGLSRTGSLGSPAPPG